MKLVNIAYVDDIGALPKSDKTYTYAAGNDVEVGQYRWAIARGKQLKALVVSGYESGHILPTLNTLPYPITSLQVLGEVIEATVDVEEQEESTDWVLSID